MQKDNPIIEDIVISPEKLAEYELRIKGNPHSPIQLSSQGKMAISKKMLGGACTICANPPSKKVIYDAGDNAKVVERYCDKCFQSWVTRQELRKYTKHDKVYLRATNGMDHTLAVKMQEWRERNGYGTKT